MWTPAAPKKGPGNRWMAARPDRRGGAPILTPPANANLAEDRIEDQPQRNQPADVRVTPDTARMAQHESEVLLGPQLRQSPIQSVNDEMSLTS